jgi:hypothetical protein
MAETETGAQDTLPAGLTAMLLAEPPADFLGLALRWLPVDQAIACRLAALACALLKAPLNPAAANPEDQPGAKILTEFEQWLRPGKDTTVQRTALRIFCLHFACQPPPPPPGTKDAAALKQIITAADWLLRWAENGKTRRPSVWERSP